VVGPAEGGGGGGGRGEGGGGGGGGGTRKSEPSFIKSVSLSLVCLPFD